MKKCFVMWTNGVTTHGKHIFAENREEAIAKANIPKGWSYMVGCEK